MLPTMTKPRKTALARRLTALREKLGEAEGRKKITQAEAAKRIGLSVRAWLSWERGEQEPSPAHLLLIKMLEQGNL